MKADVASESTLNYPRYGLQSFATLGLLILSITGLLMLHTQVTVFDFGDSGPDARFFPRVIFWLLALVSGFRFWRQWSVSETAVGAWGSWFRVVISVISVVIVIAIMGQVGFFISVAGLGILLAWLLGERRLFLSVVIPIVIAALVAYGARYILNLPLP